jgi:AraC-like DNA-binding protein
MSLNSYPEIDEVITYIHRHLYDPLPLSRLASHAAYSQYHFSRIFKERMGLTPLYYVSSLRLQMAKQLLVRTNMNIRDIGLEIGQLSLGTFTTRFTEKVGVTPSEFRNSARQAGSILRALESLDDWRDVQPFSRHHGIVRGTIQTEVSFEGVVLIGLFAKPIPEGMPLYGTLIRSGGEFMFQNVKPGTYYLMATSVSWEMQAVDFLLPEVTLRTRSKEPIIVESGSTIPYQLVKLFLPSPDDPPILVSLPFLMNNFLNRMRGQVIN